MPSYFDSLLDLARTSGGRNIGGGVGSTVGGLIGNIFGPIGHMVGQDIGSSAGNRLQQVAQGGNFWNQLLGSLTVDAFMKPLQRVLPLDLLLGGPNASNKGSPHSNPNKITIGNM
jgi:hypothetical protein